MRSRLRGVLRRIPRASMLRRAADWRRRERMFRYFVARVAAPPAQTGKPIAVVVQPWLLSDVPWYSLLLALGTRQRGRQVVIVWDDLPWDNGFAADRMVNASIGRVLGMFGPSCAIERLSARAGRDGPDLVTEGEIAELASLNVTWRFKGHTWPREADGIRSGLQDHLASVSRAASAVLSEVQPSAIIIPGGIFSSSGVIRTVAERLNIRVATYDSGPGVMLTSCNGVAAWLSDIPRAVREIGTAEPEFVRSCAERELAGRRGDDGGQSIFERTYQATRAGTSVHGDVVIPLNQSYDTAALGRHRVFRSQIELMVETVRWVLEHSDATVVVRRHPIERAKELRSFDEYGEILVREFGHTPRVRYVAEDDAVSTYELLSSAKVVVPYTSTVGVEAAIQGVPVVTESASYYSEMGFVWPARSAVEFGDLLGRALAGELKVSDSAKAEALRVYYATQLCNFLFTPITPASGDFLKWATRDPASILSSPEFGDVLTCLVDDIPMPVLRHRRRMADR